MNKSGLGLVVLGVIGILFVLSFDIIAGKPVNDISGPKSISALIVSLLLVFIGAGILAKKKA